MISFRYGDRWGDWHGEKSGQIERIEFDSGSMINRVEGITINNSNFAWLNFIDSKKVNHKIGQGVL